MSFPKNSVGNLKISSNDDIVIENNSSTENNTILTLNGNMNANYQTTTLNLPSDNNIFIGSSSSSLNSFISNSVPVGTIVMWYKGAIPAGWVKCDGSNSTPDIQNRMVIGRNGTYVTTGGSSTVTLGANNIPVHSHAMTWVSGEGNHTHTLSHRDDQGTENNNAELTRHSTTRTAATRGTRAADWVHSHSFTTPLDCGVTPGEQTPVNIMPRYFPLIYIMKVAAT